MQCSQYFGEGGGGSNANAQKAKRRKNEIAGLVRDVLIVLFTQKPYGFFFCWSVRPALTRPAHRTFRNRVSFPANYACAPAHRMMRVTRPRLRAQSRSPAGTGQPHTATDPRPPKRSAARSMCGEKYAAAYALGTVGATTTATQVPRVQPNRRK